MIEPIARERWATFRRAAQGICAARVAHDLDLAAGDRPVAQNADALIVERRPFPARSGRMQNREFFFGQERGIHRGGSRSKSERNGSAISGLDEAALGKNLNGPASFAMGKCRLPAGNVIGIFPTER
jgi:hypothetical protein